MSEIDVIRRKKVIRAIRRELRPKGRREVCFICGRYPSLTEAHHVPSVVEIADYCAKYGVWFAQLTTVDFVWLCPTHHAAWHAVVDSATPRGVEILNDLDATERKRYSELSTLVSRVQTKFIEELLRLQKVANDAE